MSRPCEEEPERPDSHAHQERRHRRRHSNILPRFRRRLIVRSFSSSAKPQKQEVAPPGCRSCDSNCDPFPPEQVRHPFEPQPEVGVSSLMTSRDGFDVTDQRADETGSCFYLFRLRLNGSNGPVPHLDPVVPTNVPN